MPDAPEPVLHLDRFIPYLLNVLATRMSRELGATYGERFAIGIPEWRLIAHLATTRRVSVREVFERVAMDKAKVSRAAASLVASGHVRKRENAADRRLVSLELTAKGRRLYAAIVPLALAYEEKSLSVLSGSERQALLGILGKLLAGAGGRPAGSTVPGFPLEDPPDQDGHHRGENEDDRDEILVPRERADHADDQDHLDG